MNFKKSIASILAVMMIVGTFPMYAFANDDIEKQSNEAPAVAEEISEEAAPAVEAKEVKEAAPAEEFEVIADEAQPVVAKEEEHPEGDVAILIRYIDENGNMLREHDEDSLPTGASYYYAYPAIEGYHPADGKTIKDGVVRIDPPGPLFVNMVYAKDSYDVTVKYVDEWGKTLRASEVISVQNGAAFNYEAPVIGGYDAEKPSYEIESVKKDQDVVIKYLKKEFEVTIHFVKDDEEFDSQTYTVKRGETLTYECPEVTGYDVPFDSYTVTTDPIDMDRDIEVDYSRKHYQITIHYEDEFGDKIADDETLDLVYGAAIGCDAPEIEGYEAYGPGLRIDFIDKNQEFTFTYLKKEFEVVVHFAKDGEEFDSQTYTVKRGETLTYTCPQVKGYVIPFDSYTVTTDAIDMDRDITVDYSKEQYKITVHYVDKNGKKVAPDTVEQVEYMGSIEIDNPVVKGYKTDADAISISNVDEDMEVSVVYTKVKKHDNKKDDNKKDDSKKSKSPKTGDDEPLMLMIMLMMAAGAGILGIRKKED